MPNILRYQIIKLILITNTLLLSSSIMVTMAVAPPGENSTFGSFDSAPMEKLSTKMLSLKVMLRHLLSIAADPTGKTTV